MMLGLMAFGSSTRFYKSSLLLYKAVREYSRAHMQSFVFVFLYIDWGWNNPIYFIKL